MKYKSVVVMERGGPDGLQIEEKELRVRVLASPSCCEVGERENRFPAHLVCFVPFGLFLRGVRCA